MTKKVTLHKNDIERIQQIILENNVQVFDLLVDNSSGIGYTVDMEFPYEVSGREAVIRISVVGVENW
jgi:hypothetical protein